MSSEKQRFFIPVRQISANKFDVMETDRHGKVFTITQQKRFKDREDDKQWWTFKGPLTGWTKLHLSGIMVRGDYEIIGPVFTSDDSLTVPPEIKNLPAVARLRAEASVRNWHNCTFINSCSDDELVAAMAPEEWAEIHRNLSALCSAKTPAL